MFNYSSELFLGVAGGKRCEFTNVFFSSTRSHPCIKEVHSRALITILSLTKGMGRYFRSRLRK
ncbi:MAG TPA: hypothetical protein DC012_06185 [Escherichia sp.]|nr:hypothetical protein [Escherichia sp.]